MFVILGGYIGKGNHSKKVTENDEKGAQEARCSEARNREENCPQQDSEEGSAEAK